jgi:hypothetical protein
VEGIGEVLELLKDAQEHASEVRMDDVQEHASEVRMDDVQWLLEAAVSDLNSRAPYTSEISYRRPGHPRRSLQARHGRWCT